MILYGSNMSNSNVHNHFPLPTLVAAADATSQVRVGTFVLNVGLWDPGRLVRELATVDHWISVIT